MPSTSEKGRDWAAFYLNLSRTGGDVVVYRLAGRPAFLVNSPAHAARVLDDAQPLGSHVLLAKGDAAGGEDGMLEARELMQLELRADLVVLSACETARGRVGAGEGVLGLTWALFVAGSPTTVVSQWKVEESSTTELMVEFHRLYRDKLKAARPALSTAGALRSAALALSRKERYAHPFYWAGFVVVGDGR